MPERYRILVIENRAEEAARLKQLLRRCRDSGGRRGATPDVTALPDTAAALRHYSRLCPDLVIYGPAAARGAKPRDLQQLRGRAGIEPVPILFVKADTETISSACLDTGCDDILLKPYSLPLVQLKLAALRRLSDFSRALLAQRNRIRRSHADLLQQQEGARQIFDNMGHESCLDQTGAIRYQLSPRALLNGDVLAAAYAPGGKLMLLLGDFTGHGLAAAVGAVPLTAIFYSMVPKGFSLSHILREINSKLYGILPPQMFCCAVMLELDSHKQRLRLFNAGMPSACLYRGGQPRLLESRHLPLGVMPEVAVEDAIVPLALEPGDRLYLWSDGVHEARNRRGELFGQERLLQALAAPVPRGLLFGHLLAQVSIFAEEQSDDLSLVEVALDQVQPGCPHNPAAAAQSGRMGDWSFEFTLGPDQLRDLDPLPLLHNLLAPLTAAEGFREELFTVLGELFRNALEHGLLGLDSSLKQSESGFSEYYRRLERGRRALQRGWVKVGLCCRGGALEVNVEDSGRGFPGVVAEGNTYAGRGLPLLRALCRELHIAPGSSRVRAVLHT